MPRLFCWQFLPSRISSLICSSSSPKVSLRILTEKSIAPRLVVKPSAPSWIKSMRRYSIVMVIPVGFEPTSPGLKVRYPSVRREDHMELPVGFEPTIHCLQGRCVTVALQEQIGDPREIRTHTSRIKSPVSYQLDERIMVSRVGIQPTFRSP